MKFLFALPLMVATLMMSAPSQADSEPIETTPIEASENLAGEEAYDLNDMTEMSWWQNPPGSRWITVRCNGGFRGKTCLPPAGYKFRHFNLDVRGNDCRKWRVEFGKDAIHAPKECRIVGRAFVWPAQYCQGQARYCK